MAKDTTKIQSYALSKLFVVLALFGVVCGAYAHVQRAKRLDERASRIANLEHNLLINSTVVNLLLRLNKQNHQSLPEIEQLLASVSNSDRTVDWCLPFQWADLLTLHDKSETEVLALHHLSLIHI